MSGIYEPFSRYHRAKLERLVQEGFERIEYLAFAPQGTGNWCNDPNAPLISAFDFQVLVAADFYLRSTKETTE